MPTQKIRPVQCEIKLQKYHRQKHVHSAYRIFVKVYNKDMLEMSSKLCYLFAVKTVTTS